MEKKLPIYNPWLIPKHWNILKIERSCMIELRGLSKSFAGKLALDNVDLFIQEGEIFGIIGKSGAGKSTLLRCINLLEKPEHGEVIIDSQYLMELSRKELALARHKMAMIFQHFNLLNSKN